MRRALQDEVQDEVKDEVQNEVQNELRVVGTGLPATILARAQAAVLLETLEQLLHFGFAQRPAWELADVIIQDEFTHDVVVTGPAPAFLVFDTT